MTEMPRRITTPPMDPEPPHRPRGGRSGAFGVLDIGTTKIACLIGRTESDGTPRVLGFGWQKGRGVRAGSIIDLDEAERGIRAVVGQAEDMADFRLRAVTINLSCGQPESRLFNVQWPVGGRAVTSQDLQRVISEGRDRAETAGRETIHTLPLGFGVDDVADIGDPRGQHCETLTARLHVIDASSTALRTLGACIQRCDLDIAELVSAPMAASLATLVEDERQLGTILLDLGGGTTGMAVIADGHVIHTGQIPIGGHHVTMDIAKGLSTSISHAERLKALYGNARASPDDERELLAVPQVGEDDSTLAHVPRATLINIIRPRLEETFELVRDRLDGSGLGRAAGNRVVLTGGGSQLSGLRELAAHVLGRQVRLGRPGNLRGLPDAASGPAFATAAGLLAWTAQEGRTLADLDLSPAGAPSPFHRLRDWLRRLA